MSEMLGKYTLRPTNLGSRRKDDRRKDEDFIIRFNGRDVGRTYAVVTPTGPMWYWSIYIIIDMRSPLPEDVIVQGLAHDLATVRREAPGLRTWTGCPTSLAEGVTSFMLLPVYSTKVTLESMNPDGTVPP